MGWGGWDGLLVWECWFVLLPLELTLLPGIVVCFVLGFGFVCIVWVLGCGLVAAFCVWVGCWV